MADASREKVLKEQIRSRKLATQLKALEKVHGVPAEEIVKIAAAALSAKH